MKKPSAKHLKISQIYLCFSLLDYFDSNVKLLHSIGLCLVICVEFIYRVYPVMENLEKLWNSIFLFQAFKSHGN